MGIFQTEKGGTKTEMSMVQYGKKEILITFDFEPIVILFSVINTYRYACLDTFVTFRWVVNAYFNQYRYA